MAPPDVVVFPLDGLAVVTMYEDESSKVQSTPSTDSRGYVQTPDEFYDQICSAPSLEHQAQDVANLLDQLGYVRAAEVFLKSCTR